MGNLPTSVDKKYHSAYPTKARYQPVKFILNMYLYTPQISAASTALYLAQLPEPSPPNSNPRALEVRKMDRRPDTNPRLTLSAPLEYVVSNFLGNTYLRLIPLLFSNSRKVLVILLWESPAVQLI